MPRLPKKYENDPQLNAVSLGLDVEHFISTHDRLGQYLVERAHQKRIDALEALVGICPTKTEEIRKLQWEARIPDMLLSWLDEAIAAGKMAEAAIEVEDSGY